MYDNINTISFETELTEEQLEEIAGGGGTCTKHYQPTFWDYINPGFWFGRAIRRVAGCVCSDLGW